MSKCGNKNKEVAHELQTSVSVMFLLHFDIFCDLLLNRPTATWNLFVLYRMLQTVLRPIRIVPALYWWLFMDLLLGPKCYFLSALLLFFLILLVHSFFEKFFNVFTCSKHKNVENVLKNSESLLVMTHNGNCCEDFLLFRHSQVVKNSFCLHFFIFLLCKQPLLNFFPAFLLLINPKLCHKYFQNRTPCWAKQRKQVCFFWCHPLYLYSSRSWATPITNHSHGCINY